MSMTRDQLIRHLDDPSGLNERTLGELREILEEYPYFQSAHLLYIRNLQKEQNFRFSGQLKTCAIYATDRTILYQLLNQKPKGQLQNEPNDKPVVLNQEEIATIELSDEQTTNPVDVSESMIPAHVSQINGPSDLLNFELSDRIYSLEGMQNENDVPLAEIAKEIGHLSAKKESEDGLKQKAELIDRFINEKPAFTAKQPKDLTINNIIESNIENTGEGDEFITETLARIYMKQGLYQKSIQAFQRLSLKYPEKSVYFARQIEEVTNLINK